MMQTPMSKQLESKFISLFCAYKNEGLGTIEARFKTHYKMQDYIINEIKKTPANAGILITAYEQIKLNKSLLEKAQITYD
jgi:hypothetical protein